MIELLPLLNEDNINKSNYDDDVEKISKIINGLINSEKFQQDKRFDYTNNKEDLKNELVSQVGIYSYSDSVKHKLVSSILWFMNELESEEEMPKKYVSNQKTDYFDAKLSEHWNKLKTFIVDILGKNVGKKIRDRNM